METKWLLLGFFAKYFFRFMSTIILTRIFTPDVFGIMAIMFTVITGLQMISDIGIQASILQNKNSSDPNFLKTAWTLQIIRNIILCAVVIFISPQLSVSYDTPNLAIYMPILSLTIFIQGFKSTSVALYYKNVKVRELTIMEMIAQGFCFLVTIVLAYVLNSIWAFIIGLILAELLKLLYSYYFLIGGVVGIALDKKYSQEIIKFGKWIFLATAFTFIIGEGNKLIFGLFLTKHELGIYHVASMIALVPIALITEYNGKITLPKLTFTYNYKTSEFIQEFERRQNVTLLSFLTFTCLLMLSGNLIITTIYNENYFAAGKVFTILMMTVSFNTIFFSISPIFLSLGNSFYHMLNQKIYGISTVGFALLGYYINDYFGLLYGLVLASFLQTFVTLFLARRLIAVKYQNTLLSVFLVIIFIIISQLYSQ
jgi:O-antigen/teichoic acid export membrane protein